MKMLDKIKARPGAKLLIDVEIPEASWEPDFQIVDKYQKFADEIIRVSLLGIGGYAFLVTQICMKLEVPLYANKIDLLRYVGMELAFGSIPLGLSLALAMSHRFYSTSCLYYQILIMRSLKRLENAHWTADEKEMEKHILEDAREKQRINSRTSHRILVCSVILFVVGFIFLLLTFFHFFTGLHN